MENIDIEKQIQRILKGESIELVPVTEEHIEFICDEESNEELWCYEEHVETDKDRIRKKFIKRIEENDVFDFIVKRSSDGVQIGIVYIFT